MTVNKRTYFIRDLDCKSITSAWDEFNELHFIKFAFSLGVSICTADLLFVLASIEPFSICSFVPSYFYSKSTERNREDIFCMSEMPSEMQVIHNCSSAHRYIELSFVNETYCLNLHIA